VVVPKTAGRMLALATLPPASMDQQLGKHQQKGTCQTNGGGVTGGGGSQVDPDCGFSSCLLNIILCTTTNPPFLDSQDCLLVGSEEKAGEAC